MAIKRTITVRIKRMEEFDKETLENTLKALRGETVLYEIKPDGSIRELGKKKLV